MGIDVAALPNVAVTMVRETLLDIPHFELPAGYRVRMYRNGDGATWTAIQMAAEPFIPVTDELFHKEYGDALDALPDRMFFIETEGGEAVASISAWWERNRHDSNDRGRIHWVVVHPAHQRRGLTKPMMTLAMQRLARSHRAAMLGTHLVRPYAIKVYLDFGFLPDAEEVVAKPEVAEGWRLLAAQLSHPDLTQWLAAH